MNLPNLLEQTTAIARDAGAILRDGFGGVKASTNKDGRHNLVTEYDTRVERFLADANIFMEYFSTLVVAWQWLQMGVTAKQLSITGAGNFTEDYLEGVLHTMRFYFTYEVPKMNGLVEIMRNEEELTLLKEKAHF